MSNVNNNDAIATIANYVANDDWEEAAIIFLACYHRHQRYIASKVSRLLPEENLTRWQMLVSQSIDREKIEDFYYPDT